MKIYCISGLGADHTVFDRLDINGEKVCISWIPSFEWESLKDYARRLTAQVDTSEPFLLLGVSFGGMLAVEMNKFISPEKNHIGIVSGHTTRIAWMDALGTETYASQIHALIYVCFKSAISNLVFWC